MILGHAALAVLTRKTVFRSVPWPLLLLASYGPDLIDKTGMLLARTSSKGIGHTLLLYALLLAALAAGQTFRRTGWPGPVWLAVALLWLSHLLLDLTQAIILAWPFCGPFPATDPYDLADGFLAFYSGHGNRAVLALDLVCIACALVAILCSRWPGRTKSA